jgi:Domain of unknown function (DUF6458)
MYRITGLGTSIVLLAAGAILAWAVDAQVNGVDLHAVGIILFIVGAVGMVVVLLAGLAAPTHEGTTVIEHGPVYEERPPRYVERETYGPPPRERVIERER